MTILDNKIRVFVAWHDVDSLLPSRQAKDGAMLNIAGDLILALRDIEERLQKLEQPKGEK